MVKICYVNNDFSQIQIIYLETENIVNLKGIQIISCKCICLRTH